MVHVNKQAQPNVLLLMGSVRPGRNNLAIAHWIAGIVRDGSPLACELVDLADWPLPMNDEPELPHIGAYVQPHTRAWSEKISAADAVVFVTPQYNWGYPAALKNAIDHLYREWRGKPAAIVSYGGHGGGKCAEQLRQVGAGLKMRMVATSPALILPDEVIRQQLTLDPARDLCAHTDSIRQAFAELTAEIAAPA